jgi:uncharacterized protein YigE (DUF2233 family)
MACLSACDKSDSAPKMRLQNTVQTGSTANPYAPATEASACRDILFDGSQFTECVARQSVHDIRTELEGPDDEPLRSLINLSGWEQGRGQISFAMNAGMFDDEGRPIGLYIENGRQHHSLNRKIGPGNFHMMPNGVFIGDKSGWHVVTTDTYAATPGRKPNFATQSGPMLVIAGKLHTGISKDGASKYFRNGVGVDTQGDAHFVISNVPVSFGKLARLFRDRLDCPNALYLDGFVSALWDPATGRMDNRAPLGPLIVIEKMTRRH